jgi:hypothetical protein
MNNRRFAILLTVINTVNVIALGKYWKNGFKIVFKKSDDRQ